MEKEWWELRLKAGCISDIQCISCEKEYSVECIADPTFSTVDKRGHALSIDEEACEHRSIGKPEYSFMKGVFYYKCACGKVRTEEKHGQAM
jgi:hypothetical protein